MDQMISQEQAETLVVRIRKLMELSKSTNENEAAAAAAKAQELLLKYNVDAEAVENVKLGGQDTHLVKEFINLFGENAVKVIQWKKSLAFDVARANLCRGVGSGTGMYFLGKKHNIEVAKFLYETLVHDIERIADEKWNHILALRTLQEQHPQFDLFADKSLKHIHGKTWKASFYVGAIEVIGDRLSENLTSLKLADPGTMALVTTEDKQLQEFKHQEFPNTSKFHDPVANYRSAYQTGRAAGHQVQFKRGIGAGGSQGPALLKDGR